MVRETMYLTRLHDMEYTIACRFLKERHSGTLEEPFLVWQSFHEPFTLLTVTACMSSVMTSIISFKVICAFRYGFLKLKKLLWNSMEQLWCFHDRPSSSLSSPSNILCPYAMGLSTGMLLKSHSLSHNQNVCRSVIHHDLGDVRILQVLRGHDGSSSSVSPTNFF